MCATWWGWYLFRYCVKNDFGERFGHLRDIIGLGGYEKRLGEDLLNYSLSAISVGSKLLPIEMPDLCSRSHVSVGCKTTAEADHRVNDIMVSVRLGWGRRLGVDVCIIHARSVCLSG